MTSRLFAGRAAAILALGLSVSACDSNEPDPGGGDQEFVTGVTVTMTNTAVASDVVTLTATDADGDGGGIVFSPARATLRPNATYTATIRLVDGVNNTVVSDEIEEEAAEHLFRYAFDPAAAGTAVLTDRESQYEGGTRDLPVGLAFRVTTAAGATGNAVFNATLFHFSDAADKSSATATSDERDIDIDFPVSFAAPTVAAGSGQ